MLSWLPLTHINFSSKQCSTPSLYPFIPILKLKNLTFLVKTNKMTKKPSSSCTQIREYSGGVWVKAEDAGCIFHLTTDSSTVLSQKIFSEVFHYTDFNSRPNMESWACLQCLFTYSITFYWTPTNLAEETEKNVISSRCLTFNNEI